MPSLKISLWFGVPGLWFPFTDQLHQQTGSLNNDFKDKLRKEMQDNHQIVISGVGGQGVLFITRLLAEAAIQKGLPVFTSETHGMAQRGGTVISHLKVGEFSSPLIVPGCANGLIALKAECLDQHGGYLTSEGWATVNSAAPLEVRNRCLSNHLDADRLARDLENPKALNLIMLGFTLAGGRLYCSLEEMKGVLEDKLRERSTLLEASMQALDAGAGQAMPA
jgi:indolepyruvate ferredoxin oxidoreductase beta subunit